MAVSFKVDFSQVEKSILQTSKNIEKDKQSLLLNLGNYKISDSQLNVKKQQNYDGSKMKDFKTNTLHPAWNIKGTGKLRSKTATTIGNTKRIDFTKWNKRTSKKGRKTRYSESSLIMKNEGTLLKSIRFLYKTSNIVIIGFSSLAKKYAYYQNSLRQILGISNKNIKDFGKITNDFLNKVFRGWK